MARPLPLVQPADGAVTRVRLERFGLTTGAASAW
jgi:hypothetical protein